MSEHHATEDTEAGTLSGAAEVPSLARARRGPPRGSTIGRYVVLHTLGTGGMGVVVAAYDPELDRKLAIKLLHEGGSQLRLLAEAQALARLHDPNVVTVHDVGAHEGRVFLAMELVQGLTLTAWRALAQPPWTRVLEVMIRAGRGLAAAHARDLVHRDFKPDNVMIGDDGRVRVMDFGLAWASDDLSSEEQRESRPRERALGLTLTRQGVLVGTPAYMAPERLSGRRGGPAADQFAFCVSLWEALYGQRPFAGQTVVELQARILDGAIARPPAGARVPRWLRRAAERGLAVDPARRWPSMRALLDVLARGRARARWRARGLALAAGGAVGLAAWGVERLSGLAFARACEAEGASIEAAWNDDVAAATAAALQRTGASHAEATAARLRPWLDVYASDWQRLRTAACLDAGRVRVKETDPARACLDERRTELEALVTELGSGRPETAETAVPAAASLGPLAPCTDADRLARLPTPPAGEHAAVASIRSTLAQAAALRRTGAHARALETARAALAEAEARQWPPLVAEARIELAASLVPAGAHAEAEAALASAYFEAAGADAGETAADAAGRLAVLVGTTLARHRHGLRWARHEALFVARLSDPTGLRDAERLAHEAAIHRALGDHVRARALYERVLERREAALGPRHLDVAAVLLELALVHEAAGELARPRVLREQALSILAEALGPEHPRVAEVARLRTF